jgi:hypothetical protein
MKARAIALFLALTVPATAQSPNPVTAGKAYNFEKIT